MKKFLEFLVCFLHPVTVVLIWLNLMGRTDITGAAKVLWALLVIIPVVPFFYIFLSGDLW